MFIELGQNSNPSLKHNNENAKTTKLLTYDCLSIQTSKTEMDVAKDPTKT